jgi:hypothetical protein
VTPALWEDFLVYGVAETAREPLKNNGIFWQPMRQQKINLAGSGLLQVVDF